MQKNLAVAVSVIDLVDADEHNGRVFVEVPITAGIYDELRFRATDNNTNVSEEAAKVLESALNDLVPKNEEPTRESLLKRVEEALQEVDELMNRMAHDDACAFYRSVSSLVEAWDGSGV